MKTILITCLVFLAFCTLATAQNNLSETEKLAATAKVWGFLKYYHPKVAKGKVDWDKELIGILPKVKKASTKGELSDVFGKWIDDLGKVKECKTCKDSSGLEYFNNNFDLSWIQTNQAFTSELSDKLKYIEQNRHQGKKFYVPPVPFVHNIKVSNEKPYKDFNWNNENLRLLTLFRYWNIVEYFFPYKYQTDTNWNDVLTNMIPKFLYSDSELAFQLAMQELIVNIDDSHASFSTPETDAYFGQYWMPASFKLIDGKAIIAGFYNDSLAKKDDLQRGDIITKVNDQEIATILSEKQKYINGSNTARKYLNANYYIFNGSTDSVKIEFTRNNQTHTKSTKRYLFNEFNVKAKEVEKYSLLDGNIGYVHMGVLNPKDVSGMMEALKDTEAIIFDIRNYPRGTLFNIAHHISSEKRDFYTVIYPDLDYPGKFVWRNGNQSGQNGDLKYKGKVILLVNEKAQSHAEFTIMRLQTGDNVTTIGSQSSGADGNVSHITMADGNKTRITGIGIFYPDRTETQRKGVKVDIEVKPTIQGIIDGKDEVLEKAIEFVNSTK